MQIFFLAIVLSLAGTSLLQGQTISTTAGNGTQGSSGDGGSPTSANLNLPMGVAGDTSGTIYIADTGNHRIRRINAAHNSITTYAGTGTAGFSRGIMRYRHRGADPDLDTEINEASRSI